MRKNPSLKKYDEVDMFIAKNWWVMCVPGLEDEPGLRVWSSMATIHLLELLQIYASVAEDENRKKWYNERRRKLGKPFVPLFRPAFILDIDRKAGGGWIVTKRKHILVWRDGSETDMRDEMFPAWRAIAKADVS